MEDKLKRYEKVEFLGEGQVVKILATPYLMKQGYIMKSLIRFFFMNYIVLYSNIVVPVQCILTFLFFSFAVCYRL
jgi:hypothetical protein